MTARQRILCQELWTTIYSACASSENQIKSSFATANADKAVEEFKQRFCKPKKTK